MPKTNTHTHTTTWNAARLIPTSGIRGAKEQERRATSALLAVLVGVREFRRALLKPLGAPPGKIETFCEVPFTGADGKRVRVDGLIRVVHGQRTWTCLVEVKTGRATLGPEQLTSYLDVVRQEKFDGLLTVSNEIASVYGRHPVEIKGQRYKHLALHHRSWARILATAIRTADHTGVEDPDQAWVLAEFIRYLQHEQSGARVFADMGAAWNPLRTALRAGTLRSTDDATESVVLHWEQLIQHICLSLSARLGGDVHPVLTRREAQDPARRTQSARKQLATAGTLAGGIVIPNAVGPIRIAVDLSAMDATASVTVPAPRKGQPGTRLNWLLRQCKQAPDALRLDVAAERMPGEASALLGDVRRDPKVVLARGGKDHPPRSFTVTEIRRVNKRRRTSSATFIADIERLVDSFYRGVVQGLKAWTPPPPRLPEQPAAAAAGPPAGAADPAADPVTAPGAAGPPSGGRAGP